MSLPRARYGKWIRSYWACFAEREQKTEHCMKFIMGSGPF